MPTDSSSVTRSAGSALDDRLGQPRADVALAPLARRAQRVEREPADDRGQPRAQVAHLVGVGPLQAQPRLLHDVLGLGERAELAVGDAQQVRALRLEASASDRRRHRALPTRALRRGDGAPPPRSHAAKPVRRARRSGPSRAGGGSRPTRPAAAAGTGGHERRLAPARVAPQRAPARRAATTSGPANRRDRQPRLGLAVSASICATRARRPAAAGARRRAARRSARSPRSYRVERAVELGRAHDRPRHAAVAHDGLLLELDGVVAGGTRSVPTIETPRGARRPRAPRPRAAAGCRRPAPRARPPSPGRRWPRRPPPRRPPAPRPGPRRSRRSTGSSAHRARERAHLVPARGQRRHQLPPEAPVPPVTAISMPSSPCLLVCKGDETAAARVTARSG